MRSVVSLSLAVLALATGCSGGSHSPVVPLTALVRFDSLSTVSEGGQAWQAFAVSNIGNAAAFRVRVFWHVTGQDTARASRPQPPDLAKGQAGPAATRAPGTSPRAEPSRPD